MTTQQARVWPTSPTPLGAAQVGNGRNFALLSTHPKSMELCLFDQAGEPDRQLAAAAAVCTQGGMAVGLYRDLALGVDPRGAEAWADQRLLANAISIGAPPDGFSRTGQSWGLPPFNPHALRAAAYQPFIECLRANMRHAGALRSDHIMGFARLFWIPADKGATEGGYVRYPIDDLVAITALESQRAGCAVVGEDLGTVLEGLRERLGAAHILSTRLLYFERDDAGFRPADTYPALAHVAIGTHDLPTFPGWWRGRDIELHEALGMLKEQDQLAAQQHARTRERAALAAALRAAGLEISDAALTDSESDVAALVDAVYRFLAASPGRLLIVQLEDVLGVEAQVNLPGTTEEHPNWRRKLALSAEDLAVLPRLRRLADALRALRPLSGHS
jgi:4-alpha-glucanotransferase